MRRLLYAALLSSISTAAFAADGLPLKRVVITTSGLALYEHRGDVTGNEDINIPVRLGNVDDMLKSLVVMDAKGSLGGVSLPGREPLSQAFRDLPFTQGDLTSLVQLLNALRGADVQADDINGRLMNVVAETEQSEEGIIIRNRVSILTATGIKTALMENLGALKFTDTAVQAQLDRALEALFTNRIKDNRTLTVKLRGDGTRPVALAYIQDAPLWKSSYRLVLPKDGDNAKALLQGWAVLENTTGQDWNDVGVTLMSGSPVIFRQSLYESYYLPRPELPVKIMDRIMPRIDSGTVARAKEESDSREGGAYEQESRANMMEKKALRMEGMAADMAMPSAPAMAMAENVVAGYAGGGYAAEAPAPMAQTISAAAGETASQMVFAFPEPVDLPSGNTLMIPFVSHELPAEKVWVYQPETNALHPLAAVAVKNDAGSGLPPGILTLFDSTDKGLLHVGDADMPLVPKGEDRFISFALDTKTKIDQQTQDDRQLGLITVSKGFLKQKAVWQNTTTYTIRAPEDEDRTIVIEHPRRTDWDLIAPEGITGEPETTSTHHRLRVNVAKGKDATIKVTLKNEQTETFALADMDPGDLAARMSAVGKDLPAALRKALERVQELRGKAFALQQKLYEIQNERQTIYSDQERLRENIKTVTAGTDMGRRYLKSLEQQENRLEQLTRTEEETNAALRAASEELQNYVATLDF